MSQKLDINYAFAHQKVTGQQRYATEITRSILEIGEKENLDVKLIKIPESGSRLVEWIFALSLWLWKRRGSWLLTMTSRGPLFSKRHAFVVHDLFPITNKEFFGRFYALSHGLILKAQIKHASLIICVSEPIRAQVQRLGLARAPIIVAPNAPAKVFLASEVDVQFTREVLDSFGLRANQYFLTVGSHDPRKNLDLLIEAHGLLEDSEREGFPLVIVGASFPVFGSVDLKVAENIHLLTDVPDNKLAVLYSNAASVVIPSKAEGFGLPVVEAMACGAELILNDIEVFRWICGDEATFVDCSLGAQQLGMALKLRVSRTSPPKDRIRYMNKFSWSQSAKVILEATLGAKIG
jgi:glycosyltransferase involved in cell wall biosynthesis